VTIVVFLYKVWVYGNSFKSVLVAVVVPNEEITKKWAYTNGFVGSFPELCSLDQFKKYVLSELKLTAERNKVTHTDTKIIQINEPIVFFLCYFLQELII
jgi:long-chain acyl-CoA synthetase